MKRILVMVTALVVLSFTSCQKDYKRQGEEMAKQLDELCQKQDGEAAFALDQNIADIENKLVASKDTASLNDFREALKDVRRRNAAYLTTLKVGHGQAKDSVIQDVVNDALINDDADITSITSSIDAVNEQETKK